MSTDAPVGPPVPGPTRRPRTLLLGAAIAILAVAAVVLAVLLLRDPDAGPKPSALPSEQELATLRAEAVAATKTLFERIDQAYATGDPKVLDGLYVPGGEIEAGQKQGVADAVAANESITVTLGEVQVDVIQIDRLNARTRIRRVIEKGEVRDRRSGKLTDRLLRSTEAFEVGLARQDGRWLVEAVDVKEER